MVGVAGIERDLGSAAAALMAALAGADLAGTDLAFGAGFAAGLVVGLAAVAAGLAGFAPGLACLAAGLAGLFLATGLATGLAAVFLTAAAGFLAAFLGGGALFAVDLLMRSPGAALYPLGEPVARRQAGI